MTWEAIGGFREDLYFNSIALLCWEQAESRLTGDAIGKLLIIKVRHDGGLDGGSEGSENSQILDVF